MKAKIYFWGAILIALISALLLLWGISAKDSGEQESVEQAPKKLLYGIEVDNYDIHREIVGSGENFSTIFGRYGISAATTYNIEQMSDSIFKLRNIRAEHPYTVFLSKDSTASLCHLAYEINMIDYVVFSFENDSLAVRADSKRVELKRRMDDGVITVSLWNSMVDSGMSPALAMELSDIFAWSIDFFGIREGDSYKVIYDEKYVDTTRVGVGMIYGAWFDHMGKRYYAIPFRQGDKITYWDEDGNSLRKQFLKAPLKYSRISSRFSHARRHPVLKIVRPHHGVDYAAPSGTPVYAVADGVITFKGWARGGGNTIKIKHARQMQTTYMHLRGFAKGITVGKRVSQGDLIGYVGSTGLSTGPHLDFRLYRGGKAIDPLKAPSEPTEPIKEENREAFNLIRDKVLGELDESIVDSLRLTISDL